jgi:hypothetical protein
VCRIVRMSIDTCHEAMTVYVDKKYTGNVYGCIILRFVLCGYDRAKGKSMGLGWENRLLGKLYSPSRK